MSKYKTPAEKKDEFRRYLETSGAINALTVAMVNLFEEENKPLDSTNYLLKQLGGRHPQGQENQQQLEELHSIKKQNKKLKEQVKEMTKTIEALRKNLIHLRSQQKKPAEQE